MVLRVLQVEDDVTDRMAVRRALNACGLEFELVTATEAATAAKLIKEIEFDCVILDYRLPDMDGIEFLRQHGVNGHADIPVVFLTGQGSETVAVAAMREGAHDYIVKEKLKPELLKKTILKALETAAENKRAKDSRNEIKRLALYDPLTKLANRYLFEDRLQHAIATARRSNTSFYLMVLDLDGFKAVNDRHGHRVGDEVLREISHRINKVTREADTAARLGGDEFTYILELGASEKHARLVAERLAAAIEKPIIIRDLKFDLTVSIGIACFPEQADNADALIEKADMAMFEAKRNGWRYCIVES